jgi:sugar phosphate isomerase/epimerase
MPDLTDLTGSSGASVTGDTAWPWRFAVSEWTLRERYTERALERIAAAGFDAVELGGARVHQARARRALAETGLYVTSVCPLFGAEHDFAADDPAVRQAAADLLRRWVEFAGEVGASAVIVVPSDRPVPCSAKPRHELLARSAEIIAGVANEYGPVAPTLVIEPLNRYETHLVRSLAEAEQLRRLIASDRVALMGDVFHMNLEEDSLAAPLLEHAGQIRHMHLADNQRREPGSGRLEFAEVFRALAAADYAGVLALEFLPATDAALRAARRYLEQQTIGLATA